MQRGILVIGVILIIACQGKKAEHLFEKGRSQGVNKNPRLEEPSGLVASVKNPNQFWTHNDSGNGAMLFLLDSKGQTERMFALAGLKNRDWEDITLGPGPGEGSYLYIGDIGDNLAQYPYKYIYRLKEPALNDPEIITEFDTLTVQLTDGTRDSETLLCDPLNNNLYLISKREDSVRLYEIIWPSVGDSVVVPPIARLPLTYIVAGDVSPDGSEVLLKNYDYIYYWKRKEGETLSDLLQTPATELPYDREPQGEAITWARDGSGFFTLSENAKGERGKLLFFKRK